MRSEIADRLAAVRQPALLPPELRALAAAGGRSHRRSLTPLFRQAARWVAEHGLDVTPGVFDDDYSRGHPPLFYLLAGAAFLLFGVSPTVWRSCQRR